jgi:transglutaminase-like putative cysteine protease
MKLRHAIPTARLHLTALLLKRPCVVSDVHSLCAAIISRLYGTRKDARMKRLLPLFLLFSLARAQVTRHFAFQYSCTVKNVPAGGRLRIWIPAAHSDDFQEVKVVSAVGDLGLRKTHESRFGNEMYYAETLKARQSDFRFEVVYDVVRHERLTLGVARPRLAEVQLKDRDRKEYLQPDKLVPVTGLPADLAVKVTEDKATPLDKARAIYDYVFTTMRYDMTGTGWGHGDVLYACDTKKGNCTDFHSLFIAMARSQGIPARFEIGFSLPPDTHLGEIAGYHCWSDFFEPQHGWIPVDISEAWKHQEKRDYFFGAHDTNRVQFTMGRDLRLSPSQDGPPLNYFVYPYVEVAGKEYPDVSLSFSFADVDEGKAAAK